MMYKTLKIRLATDLGMTVLLVLLMSYQLVGKKTHEWIGMEMFLFVIMELVLLKTNKWILHNVGFIVL